LTDSTAIPLPLPAASAPARERIARALLVIALLCGLSRPALPARAAPDPDPADFFEKEVRPVLLGICARCHGHQKQRGGLRLDSREAIIKGGESGPGVVPGQPGASLLIAAIGRQGELKMPPDEPLGPRQVAALHRWVELGAAWPDRRAPVAAGSSPGRSSSSGADHWSFQPLGDPRPPAAQRVGWLRTPVDAFILARQEAAGLAPSPPADRRTLIRRATYDLTGLPPTPEAVEAFVRDQAPDAYPKLVDRLLASPHHGEHWGRHWLDVARYSDTKGYVYAREERFWVHAWAYRDWVVRALNADMPYDRFVLLQLAADQVAADDPPSLAAMGYLTLGRRYLGVTHDIIDDRIDVVTRGLLGLTVTCARCHDHKFDPIPTEDYYALYGVFRSCTERLVLAARSIGASTEAQAFGREVVERLTKLDLGLAAKRQEAAARARARVTDYLLAQLELNKYPEEGFDQILASDDLVPAMVRRWRDYLARASAPADPVWSAWHAFARLPDGEFAARAAMIGRDLSRAGADGTVNAFVARAFASPPRDMQDVARRYGALLGTVETRWHEQLEGAKYAPGPPPEGLADPQAEAVRQVLYGVQSPCEVPDESIVDTEGFFTQAPLEELWKARKEFDRWLIDAPGAPPYATILVDRPLPINARVFRRGNPALLGEEVPRRFLAVLAGAGHPPFRLGSGRLELARAIIDEASPLAMRVIVNRVWMHHFGAGLVLTPSDFGSRATPPSHPELLDWLARRFIEEGRSLKWLHRMIMLSATYQQASSTPSEGLRAQVDPENRLLGRMNIHRLSFEELRDSLFAVAGDLDTRAGGGKPFDLLATPYARRRTVYGLVDREFLPGLFRSFDFANPDLHIPQRNETTVPQQALFFLNHPLPLERARALAHHPSVEKAATPEERVVRLFRLAYQRAPTSAQVVRALALVGAAAAGPDAVARTRPSVWSYGYAAFDAEAGRLADFRLLPYFTGKEWQGGPSWPDSRLGWARLTASGGHAGNDLGHAVVRRWTAPAEGTVRVASTVKHDVAAGDGVRASIVSSRFGLIKSALAHNSEATLDVPSVEVRAGDTLDFVVDRHGNLNSDQFTWTPVVSGLPAAGETAAPAHWSARDEFGDLPVPWLEPWEQLAQALLMANEFCFVD
jgi:hypothetical protein